MIEALPQKVVLFCLVKNGMNPGPTSKESTRQGNQVLKDYLIQYKDR